MNKLYQYGILSLSLLVWAYFVRWFIFLFVLLAELVHIINVKTRSNSWVLLTLFVLLSILVFALLKTGILSGIYLPIGYSVFVFSSISLIVDEKKHGTKYDRLDVYNYLFFFPKAFAGPIDRTSKLIPQFHKCPSYNKADIYVAGKILLFACFCKYVLSDTLYNVDCESALGFDLWLSIISYALAFYFDFYAYSLFAIGIGRLLGIDLSMNFSSPYSSNSFKEFWQRWNITLSSWLKDYIYIPLGGSRQTQLRTVINVLVVFLISAVWHDFTLPFIIWGFCHAALVLVEKNTPIASVPGYRYIVFLIVCFLWQLFRIEDLNSINHLFYNMTVLNGISNKLLVTTAASLLVLSLVDSRYFKQLVFTQNNSTKFVYREVCVLAIMLTLVVLLPHSLNFNFFYLRF